MLYGGDDVSGAEWDTRSWHSRTSAREALFWLAVDAALRLAGLGLCTASSSPHSFSHGIPSC